MKIYNTDKDKWEDLTDDEIREHDREQRQLIMNQDAEIHFLRRRIAEVVGLLDDLLESEYACREAIEKMRESIGKIK